MQFKIMGTQGDAGYEYDTLDMQMIKFAELQSSGMLPVKTTPAGKEIMKEFDPNIDEVVWIPRIVGG